jgi:hypothetical protein
LRIADRILALFFAAGMLAAVFGLRACRNPPAAPTDPAPAMTPAGSE